MPTPVRYSPDVETIRSDEARTVRQLEAAFKDILDTTSKDYGHAVRAVHAKAHGIARGTLTVRDGLAPELAQGLFARAGSYEAIMRISTNPGDILDDSIALPRGLALKVLGVEGERLEGAEGNATQDFVLVNGPVFTALDAEHFLQNLKLLAKTTDKAEGGKKVLSGILRGIEATLEAVGLESATLQQLGGAPQVHPLGETYYSQTPFRYGAHIAKFALFPVSKPLTDLTGETIDASGRPDAIRTAVSEGLISHGGTWELRVQLNTDLETMPVENPTVQWNEKESAFVTVATLEVPPQHGWRHGETERLDDALAYSVWNALDAHRPLGNVNRARRDTYRFSQDYRGRFNGCPLHQPRTLADLPAVPVPAEPI